MRKKKLTIKMLYNILLSTSIGQRVEIEYADGFIDKMTFYINENGSLILDVTDINRSIIRCGGLSEFIRNTDLRNSKEKVYVKLYADTLEDTFEDIIGVYEDEDNNLIFQIN